MTLAVAILTKNEEKNIKECLESVAFADEVWLIDDSSEDQTVPIAQALGAKVLQHSMAEEGFAGQRNEVLKHCQADWILYVDADERITPELAIEIQSIISSPKRYAYEIIRRNCLFGQVIHHGVYGPDYNIRLFPVQEVLWQGLVHERPITNLPIKRLKGSMIHETNPTWEKYCEKFNQYTTLMAERNFEKGKRASFVKDILLRPFFAFFKAYFLQRGFLDGKLGFSLAVFHGMYTMMKYVKLEWLVKRKTRISK